MPSPFLKWVGGKRQLVPRIKNIIPITTTRLVEPFMGGAAVFFATSHKTGWLNDVNPELVNCYQVVRDKPEALIQSLSGHIYEKTYYLNIRALDRGEGGLAALSDIERASRFIYLNRTGFNGMYRVNAKGQFNVPFGRYTNPRICDADGIYACSAHLHRCQISCLDFESVLAEATTDDFIYLDPPYIPLSDTAYFTSYSDAGFNMSDQKRLAEAVKQLDRRGVAFALSNSHCAEVEALYAGFQFHQVEAARNINAKADGRQPVGEYIITNLAQG